MLRTLLLNPPGYSDFDGGAGARYQNRREVWSNWYPIWLAYPAGMIDGARLLDAQAQHLSMDETLFVARDFDHVVMYTSSPTLPGDALVAAAIKAQRPDTLVGMVGPHPTVLPEPTLRDAPAVDYVCRNEFDYSVKELAEGAPLSAVRGIVYRGDGAACHHTPAASGRREPGRAPVGDSRVQARPRRGEVQHPVDALAVRVDLHDAGLPGPVHLLPLAADDERPPVSQALRRRRHRGDDLGEDEPRRGEGVLLRRRHVQLREGADPRDRAPAQAARHHVGRQRPRQPRLRDAADHEGRRRPQPRGGVRVLLAADPQQREEGDPGGEVRRVHPEREARGAHDPRRLHPRACRGRPSGRSRRRSGSPAISISTRFRCRWPPPIRGPSSTTG